MPSRRRSRPRTSSRRIGGGWCVLIITVARAGQLSPLARSAQLQDWRSRLRECPASRRCPGASEDDPRCCARARCRDQRTTPAPATQTGLDRAHLRRGGWRCPRSTRRPQRARHSDRLLQDSTQEELRRWSRDSVPARPARPRQGTRRRRTSRPPSRRTLTIGCAARADTPASPTARTALPRPAVFQDPSCTIPTPRLRSRTRYGTAGHRWGTPQLTPTARTVAARHRAGGQLGRSEAGRIIDKVRRVGGGGEGCGASCATHDRRAMSGRRAPVPRALVSSRRVARIGREPPR